MMNAAAPSVGGERIAPIPAAASTPPPASRGYPLRCRIGQATEASVTVVAVPDPETVPRRNPASVVVRPGLVRDWPKAAKLTSIKYFPAPEYSRTAPYIVKRTM